jgi:hypothetical protein
MCCGNYEGTPVLSLRTVALGFPTLSQLQLSKAAVRTLSASLTSAEAFTLLPSLEVEADLRFEPAPLVTLGCNRSKWRCVVDIQHGRPEQRVIENIGRIHPYL